MKTEKQLREELNKVGLTNTKLAECFSLSPNSFKTSTAKNRYRNAAIKIINHIKTTKENDLQKPNA